MRILIMGGTQFIGRHTTALCLAAGDDVTVFHRGRTNPGLFPEATHLIGDRNGDLSPLSDGEWEATIDTSAYVPRQVRSLASVLGRRGGRYVHVSSVSAYADPLGPGGTEDLPLATLDDPATEQVTGETYGGLKALCESAALAAFEGAGPVSIVRPTYVAGPFDHTYRFTWWVERIARGGRVVAPGPADNPFQVIDVRDLAAFLVRLAHGDAAGTFHTVGPPPPFSFGDFLETVASTVGPAGTDLVWAAPEELAAAGVTGRQLPLWAGLEPGRDVSALDPARAVAAGLRLRPLAATVADLHAAEAAEATPDPGVGLPPEQERELAAAAAS